MVSGIQKGEYGSGSAWKQDTHRSTSLQSGEVTLLRLSEFARREPMLYQLLVPDRPTRALHKGAPREVVAELLAFMRWQDAVLSSPLTTFEAGTFGATSSRDGRPRSVGT